MYEPKMFKIDSMILSLKKNLEHELGRDELPVEYKQELAVLAENYIQTIEAKIVEFRTLIAPYKVP